MTMLILERCLSAAFALLPAVGWPLVAALITAIACSSLPVSAAENGGTAKAKIEKDDERSVSSVDTLTEAGPTGRSLGMAAEYALHEGQISKAIKLCRQSIGQNEEDLDVHVIYAQALEQAYLKSDPGVKKQEYYKECIREWVKVLRHENGDEKGNTSHGLGVAGNLYDDDDRQKPAKQHLVKLAGRAPHIWESDAKYMTYVQKTETLVAGKVVTTK